MVITFKKGQVFEPCPFEALYEPELAEDFEEKSRLFEIAYAENLYVDGGLVGEVYGVRLGDLVSHTGCTWDEMKRELWPCCGHDVVESDVYCYSTTILPEFRGNGFARMLKENWLFMLRGMGFKRVVGHSTSPAMRSTNLSLGAKEVGVFENWLGTERTAHAYLMETGL